MKFLFSALAVAVLAAPAAAQIDYRNLDRGRPTAVEDACSLERYGWEQSVGYRRLGTSGAVRHLFEPELLRLVSRATRMFDWAHLLHRQIYDAYADEGISAEKKQALVEQLIDYYLSNRALAFSSSPKSMALMDEAYHNQVFRRGFARFNGLIWAFHWLQVGLYEPLIGADSPEARRAGVAQTVARLLGDGRGALGVSRDHADDRRRWRRDSPRGTRGLPQSSTTCT